MQLFAVFNHSARGLVSSVHWDQFCCTTLTKVQFGGGSYKYNYLWCSHCCTEVTHSVNYSESRYEILVYRMDLDMDFWMSRPLGYIFSMYLQKSRETIANPSGDDQILNHQAA